MKSSYNKKRQIVSNVISSIDLFIIILIFEIILSIISHFIPAINPLLELISVFVFVLAIAAAAAFLTNIISLVNANSTEDARVQVWKESRERKANIWKLKQDVIRVNQYLDRNKQIVA